MATLKVKGLSFNVSQARKELEEVRETGLDTVLDEAERLLQKLIDDINAASAKRASALTAAGVRVNKGSYDNPLANAKVVRQKKSNGRVVVTVQHRHPTTGVNVFRILDSGHGRRQAKKDPMVFPAYDGNVTVPNSMSVGYIRMRTRQNRSGKQVPVMVRALTVGKIPPRNYYITIVHMLNRDWNKYRFTARDRRGRFSITLKRSEIKMRVVAE